MLPESGVPDAAQKVKIQATAGVDWDKLEDAWKHNTTGSGATGLLVIRRGNIVGEWYRDCDRTTAFLIYSSSKSYMSTAFGLILADFGNAHAARRPNPDARHEGLQRAMDSRSPALPDPRKSEITVRNLLNMASGVGPEPMPTEKPFETALGHAEGSPFAKLKGEPGTVFNYSNAGVSHLVLLFRHAAGTELEPFLKTSALRADRDGAGPLGHDRRQGRDRAAQPGLQRDSHHAPGARPVLLPGARISGEWAGRRVVPSSYYDFAWTGTKVKPEYGGQWWVEPRVPDAPADLVMTLGSDNNDGFVVPSLDLIFVRLGDG